MATIADADFYYKWANDALVRENSFQQGDIAYNEHIAWFTKKLESNNCFLYIFTDAAGQPVGQVRIDELEEETIIGISIDELFRGRGLGVKMLDMVWVDYTGKKTGVTVTAYIKEQNISSRQIFKNAGYIEQQKITNKKYSAYRLTKSE